MYRECQIFCDFDGTITKEDTIGAFLNRFADNRWLEIEKQWKDGEIGSRDCMKQQLELVRTLSQKELNEFFDSLEIDETFIDFYNETQKRKIPFTIVSDGFDYFIYNVLRKYKLEDIKVFTNKLEIKNGKFIPVYDDKYKACKRKSGVCKCKVVEHETLKGFQTVYIGDGLSDACVSGKINKIYAKEYLARYLSSNNIPYIEFNTFNDIKI